MGKELKRLSNDLRRLKKQMPKILRIALSTLQAEMVERIHEKGLDSNGQKIGSYSTNPISIGRKNQIRNTGKSFFKGGYKQYRSSVGLESSKVVLELTGQMRQDWSVIPINRIRAGLGFKNNFNAQKSDWLEDKYNTVFYGPTKRENKTVINIFNRESGRILK